MKLDLIGFRELGDKLGQLAEDVRGDALEDAALEAMQPVRDRAQELAPVDISPHRRSHGPHLADSIAIGVRASDLNGVDVDVGPRSGTNTAWRARFVEFGTAPHELKAHHIRPGGPNKRPLKQARAVVGVHPGTQAQPFLRPALDEQADAVLERFADALRAQLGMA